MGWVVVDGFGVKGSNDAEVVGAAGGEFWPNDADFVAGFSPFLEGMLGGEAVEFLALELRDLLALGEGGGHWLPMQGFQFGFVVKGVEMAHPTSHIEPDDAFGFGGMVERVDDSRLKAMGRSETGIVLEGQGLAIELAKGDGAEA